MRKNFDYFVIFAEMRTGSNFLEANLDKFADLECHGEAFNPHFIGYPNLDDIQGVTMAMRDADPALLIDTIKKCSGGLGGFRFFHDHDPRALEICLEDPRCAKIILTRNPLDSYISLKIAQETGQWKLTNIKRRKGATAHFDASEFDQHVARLREFQLYLLNRMQTSAQTGFYLAYEDLKNIEVINGLARFLGSEQQIEKLDASLKKQNPKPLDAKVSNFAEMKKALSELDFFDISRTPNFEPRRGPAVPGYVTGVKAPLLFMPIRSGPEQQVRSWLAALDDVPEDRLPTARNQKALRQWKRRAKQHRSFTVIRHPVARAHAAFCSKILSTDDGDFAEIRNILIGSYKLPIPSETPGAGIGRRAHRLAFVGFLEFLKANLSGQTKLRVDPNWASQAATIQGMARFALPDVVIREDEMDLDLPILARKLGYANPPAPVAAEPETPVSLAEIYNEKIEGLVRTVYQRDYMMFGFEAWK